MEIENFSGRSPWVLLQDFHAKIFAQNLTAIFVRLAQWLADARYQHRRHGYRINFANALSKMKNNLVRLFLETSPLDLSWRLLQRMADAVVAVPIAQDSMLTKTGENRFGVPATDGRWRSCWRASRVSVPNSSD